MVLLRDRQSTYVQPFKMNSSSPPLQVKSHADDLRPITQRNSRSWSCLGSTALRPVLKFPLGKETDRGVDLVWLPFWPGIHNQGVHWCANPIALWWEKLNIARDLVASWELQGFPSAKKDHSLQERLPPRRTLSPQKAKRSNCNVNCLIRNHVCPEMKGCLKYGLNCANLGIQAVAFQQVFHSSFLLDWGKERLKKKSSCLKQFLSTKMGKTASHTFLVWEQNYSMEITVTPSICDLTSKPVFSLTISLEKSRQAVREWILVMLKAKLLYRALQVLPSPTQPGSPSTPPWQTAPQQHSVCSLLKGRDHHWFLTKYSTVEPCWSCG